MDETSDRCACSMVSRITDKHIQVHVEVESDDDDAQLIAHEDSLKMRQRFPSVPLSNCSITHRQITAEPKFVERSRPASLHQSLNDDSDSLTDVSMMTRTQSSLIDFDRTFNARSIPVEYRPRKSSHCKQLFGDDQLFRALVEYADSFNTQGSPYAVQQIKHHSTSTPSKRRTLSSTHQITSLLDTDLLTRHKSVDDLTREQRSRPIQETDSSHIIPPGYFSVVKPTDDKQSDQRTTITDESKFQWEYLSDSQEKWCKSPASRACEPLPPADASQEISSASIDLPRETKDLQVQQRIHIRLPRSTPPTSIIIREIRNRPSASVNGQAIDERTQSTPHVITQRQLLTERPGASFHRCVEPSSSTFHSPGVLLHLVLNIRS